VKLKRVSKIRFWPIEILLVVLALGSAYGSLASRELPTDEDKTEVTAQEAPRGEQPNRGGQPVTGGGSIVNASGPPTSRSSGRIPGTSIDTRQRGSIQGGPMSEPENAGPPVFYTDEADDAHEGPVGPNGALSQKAFDLLRVDWAPSSNGYSTSITVAGVARDDGSYVSYGLFFPGGETCRIYYFLTPRKTAFAHAFCESSGDEYGFVGGAEGNEVISTPTAAGGTQLTATFHNRAIPPLLQTAGRHLFTLSAFTCEGIAERFTGNERSGVYCGQYRVLDTAKSRLNYRV
jgi:hypothetical protein